MPTCCTFYHAAGVKCPTHDKEISFKGDKKYEFKPNAFVGKRTDIDKECRCDCHRGGHAFCIGCMENHSASVSSQGVVRKGLRGSFPKTTSHPYSKGKYLNRY